MNRFPAFPIIVLLLFVFVVVPMFAQEKSRCTAVVFGGEVNAGENFTREIGSGLTFRIDPEKDSNGWEFEIGPTAPKAGEWDQYVYVLTPPYRNSSAREVNTGWGVTAQDAVRRSRRFSFLISRADAPPALAAMDEVLWPKSEHRQEAALGKLAALPHGSGEFEIQDSKITPGTPVPGYSDCKYGHCGEIHWIKFLVTLIVPRGFTPAKGLQVAPIQCPRPSETPLSRLARPRSR